MDPLPIDPYIPEIISSLETVRNLVLTAAPSAGKTTRVPRALYDAGFAARGEILVLEPRRLAARLAAARVAHELGQKPGETVGYSIRFDTVAGPRTRIRFLTEAILSRRMVRDPNLQGVSVVILDEFHERHLATDLALALLQRVQQSNPALKTIVMSATLDTKPLLSYLPDAKLLSIPGAPFDVSIEYDEKADERPIQDKVASAVSKLSRTGLQGDVLVFLPGAAEIRRSQEKLEPVSLRFGFQVYPLHGNLPTSEQNKAVGPSEKNKVILATNVAETSITIPGIAAVIDSGFARIAGHSPWSGFPTLSTQKISRSSAVQRAGRAGRTRAGQVLRLYTRIDFDSRPEHETPEVKRTDLTEACLLLHGAGIVDLTSFPWFEAPPQSALESAELLLHRLGALDSKGGISELGRSMLRFPVHPRLARLIIEGEKLDVADESTLLASLLSERDIRLDSRAGFARAAAARETAGSDLQELLDRFRDAENVRFDPEPLLEMGIDPGTMRAVRRAHQQLQRLASGRSGGNSPSPEQAEENIRIAVLAAFPDRVAKRRSAGSRELLPASGGTALLSTSSVVHNAPLMVAVDAEERREKAREQASTIVRLASAIEMEWLAALFPESIEEQTSLQWNGRAGRVEELRRTVYGQITLEESIRPAPASEESSRILAGVVLSNMALYLNIEALTVFRARLVLMAEHFPNEGFTELDEQELQRVIEHLCKGKRSLDEFSRESISDALINRLSGRQRSLLDREAPERIKLKAGRSLKVHYEMDRPPWIESRLQDFFGMSETPVICAGRIPLTIHLLAPNRRAVQVTRDLAGFWQRHYPSIRKELQRRYPRHAWPEKPQ